MYITHPGKNHIPVVGVEGLADFISHAPAGALGIYHVGNLAEARTTSQRADLAACLTAQAAAARRIFLVQRRRAPNRFEYLMVKRWTP